MYMKLSTKNICARLFLFSLLSIVGINASAYDFESGGIYYNYNEGSSGSSVSVTSGSSSYTGDVTIPQSVNYGGKTYSVTSIGDRAFYNCDNLTSVDILNSVTSIGSEAFAYCEALTAVTIPNSVTSIGGEAFYCCKALTSATIPNSVTSMGYSVFRSCDNLNTVSINSNEILSSSLLYYYFDEGVKEYIIGDDVTSIGEQAFYYCNGITSLTIGKNVVSIGSGTFMYCENINSVTINSDALLSSYEQMRFFPLVKECTIGEGVTTICSRAFKYCSSLVSVTIPNSVTSIGDEAFYGCSSLTSVNIPNGVTYIGEETFYGCSSITSLDIPNGVTSIGDGAFSGCSSLTSVNIPTSVTSIGGGVFSDCSSLTSVTIPNSVTSIGSYAFANCSGLSSVSIPNSVTSIGSDAFYGCNSLISVTIPSSVTSIGGGGFTECSNLSSVTINSNAVLSSRQTIANIFGQDTRASFIIGEGVTEIGESAFLYCSEITSVTIPNSVKSIGRNAFEGCESLASVTMGDAVEIINDDAFENCSSLTSIVIPNSVTSIGTGAFSRCSSLSSVTLGSTSPASTCNGLTSVGYSLFEDCNKLSSVKINSSCLIELASTYHLGNGIRECIIGKGMTDISTVFFPDFENLTTIRVESGNPVYDSRNNCNAIIETASNTLVVGCKGSTIPNSVTTIGERAFEYCRGLTSIIIPNSVTTIGESAFADCSGLTSITIPSSVTAIGGGAFYGCSSFTSVTIPNSVTNIGYGAFHYCDNLNTVRINSDAILSSHRMNDLFYQVKKYIIGDDVTSIGDYAFCDCSSLTSVTIPNSVTSFGGSAFRDCSSLTSVTIPNSVTSIGENAFYGCSSLTSVTLPNSITIIEDRTFYGCNSLTSVTIPNNVISIDGSVFEGCSSLTSVTIPQSVTNIYNSAFYGCSSLLNVYCLATYAPATGWRVFYDVPLANATLHVPVGCKETYEEVSPWNEFGTIVEGGMPEEGEIVTDLFPDCPEGEIRDAAIYLYNKGIVKGENGLLLADREATRAEVAKVSFYGAYFGPANVPAYLAVADFPSVYEDIATWTAENDFYYLPARALLYLEYGDGVTPFDRNRLNFEPSNKMARVDVLKVLLETFNIQPDLDGNNNPFPNDADVVALASKNPVKMGYIREAASLGIITNNNAEFHPYAKCTRGQAFLMLARIMQKIEAQEITDPAPQESDYFQPLNTTLATIGLGVGLQMGNFQHYTKTSFAMNGVMPLTFSHTYNSYNTTLPSVFFGAETVDNMEITYQPMGDGWSHNYHSFITVIGSLGSNGSTSDMRAVVHWGGGNIDVYKSVNGELKPESMGVYDDISIENGEVVIKSKSQVEYRFSTQGGTGANVLYLYSIKDRNGNTLTIDYENGHNGSQRISSVSDGQRSLDFYYLDGTDLLEEVKDPLNRSISFTYFDNKLTGKKQLKTFTDAEDHTTTYDYMDLTNAGASKLLHRIQLPKGNYIENEYDANRRLSQTVKGRNDVPTTKTSVNVEASYGGGNINTQSTVTVDRGTQSSTYHYTYNNNNVATNVTGDLDMFVNSSYDDGQHPEKPTSIQNNSTNVSNITYDAKGNVTSITVAGDGTLTTQMTYDEKNNLTSYTDPMNNTTTYTYDTNGNLVEVASPIAGIKTSITIGEKGLPAEVRNAMNVVTRYEYNKYGNTVGVSLPALGISSTAEYDDASRLVSMTDALERTTSFTYNDNDLLTTETDPDFNTTTYAYDKNDNLTSITNAEGGVTSMVYDNATDWLTSVEFGEATKQYSYNDDGTLDSYTKPDGETLSYRYDALGRVVSDGVNSYTYDDKLRLKSISAGGKTLSLNYDGFNRITGTSYSGYSNSYTYDNNGNRKTFNGTTYEYDKLNRLTSVTFSGKTINYTYRNDSQLSTVAYPNGMTTSFEYDEVGRLTSKQTTLSNGTIVASYEYELDNVGNILEQTSVEPYGDINLTSEDVSYDYNDANRITQAGNISFEFDANGNTTRRGNEAYSWDKLDRLTTAGSTEITYDPLGLIASYGNITFTTDPLGMGNVTGDSEGNRYIYGNGLEARIKNGKVSYYVTDFRGSVVAIVDENGTITHKYQYDEFGKVTQKQEADYNPFQYVGKYGVMYLNDHQYYMRARHYDPTIGRFLSEDPIWSTNLYPYADNNPVMGIDPEGMLSWTVGNYKGTITHYNGEDQVFMIGPESPRGEYISLDKELSGDPGKVMDVLREARKYRIYQYTNNKGKVHTEYYEQNGDRSYNPTLLIHPFTWSSHISPEARQALLDNLTSDKDQQYIYDKSAAEAQKIMKNGSQTMGGIIAIGSTVN